MGLVSRRHDVRTCQCHLVACARVRHGTVLSDESVEHALLAIQNLRNDGLGTQAVVIRAGLHKNVMTMHSDLTQIYVPQLSC